MKRILSGIMCIILFLNVSASASNSKEDLSTLKQNYKNALLFKGEQALIDVLTTLPYEEYFSDQMVVELLDRYPIKKELVDHYVATIQQDGSWSDIDYQSKDRSGWRPKIHVERILLLTRVYANKEHKYFKSKKVEKTIHQALSYWFDAKLVCPNWWYNQIGVPKTLGAAVLLFEDRLTETERVAAIEVLGQSKFGMTGQNKVWLAGNVLVKAMLEGDMAEIAKAQQQIVSEIRIGEGRNEGIKADYSFHQHGAQQQFGNYGAAFVATTSFWAKVFSNTSYAIAQDKLDILCSLVTKGYQRVLWKGYLDVNGLGRQFFKQAQRHKALSIAFSTRMLAEVDTKNRTFYNQLIADNTLVTGSPKLEGYYHFWLSAHSVNRTMNWMTSVKMSSRQIIGAESGNGDNKKGYYLGDGATYTYIDGDEYYNTAAVWDWRKIPGTTAYQTDLPLKELKWGGISNNSEFVGGVSTSDNLYGMTVMDLDRDGLKAKKSWIFTPNYVFCLGGNISSDSVCQVSTTIEQSLCKGQLSYFETGEWKTISDNVRLQGKVQKLHHNKMGYIIWSGDTEAKVSEQSGSWHDIMGTYPDVEREMDVKKIVTISQNHGTSPNAESYKYLLLPNVDRDDVSNFDIHNIKVWANDALLQIVELVKEKKIFVAAYTRQNMRLREGLSIELSDPCLFVVDFNEGMRIELSDPTGLLDTIKVNVNGQERIVNLPSGDYRGSTIALSL